MDTQNLQPNNSEKVLQALMNHKYNTVLLTNNSVNRWSRISIVLGGAIIFVCLLNMGFTLIAGLIGVTVIGFLTSKIK